MGILSRLFRGKQQDASPGWNALWGIESKMLWKSSDNVWASFSVKELEGIYALSSVVFACVRMITTSLPEAPAEVGVEKDGEWEVVEGHPVTELLRRPNMDYDYNDLIQYMATRLLLTGRGLTWKWRNNGGAVGELWPIPTSWVTVKSGESEDGVSRLYKAFVLKQAPKDDIAVPPRDMIYSRFVDPATMIEGVGPLQAAIKDYQLDSEREDYLVEMLTNLKMPGLLIHSPVELTVKQRSDMKAYLHDNVGKGARGNELLLEGEGVTAEILSPLKDLDWPGFSAMTETRICAAFGVSPLLVGVRVGIEHSTYSNYEIARRALYQDTLVPFWKMLGAVFTRSLLRQEGEETLEVRFNLDNVKALQEDATERAQRAEIGVRSGLATRNEGRMLLGLPPVDDGDVYLLPLTIVEQPQRTAQELAAEQEEPPDAEV